MEVFTETWRVKHRKNWMKHDRGEESDAKEGVPQRKKNVTLCFLCKKSKGQKRDASVQSLATSLNENCCLCVGAFVRYFKEVFRCLYCVALCHIPQMKFEQLFCEWLEATGDACRDLVFFVRKVLQVCVGNNN